MLSVLYPFLHARGSADPMSWVALIATFVVLAAIVMIGAAAAVRIRREAPAERPEHILPRAA
jgi:threonine/homoserine/homoserine lactone efflux protein